MDVMEIKIILIIYKWQQITVNNRRGMVWASLPLEKGRILDPSCGAGSTLAGATSLGYDIVGVEIYAEYNHLALRNPKIVKLSALKLNPWEINGSASHKISNYQSTLSF
jgi:tRNA1(Val) A37 N6-methylase TrmN6